MQLKPLREIFFRGVALFFSRTDISHRHDHTIQSQAMVTQYNPRSPGASLLPRIDISSLAADLLVKYPYWRIPYPMSIRNHGIGAKFVNSRGGEQLFRRNCKFEIGGSQCCSQAVEVGIYIQRTAQLQLDCVDGDCSCAI